jgi:hypothetical protein
MITGPAMLVTTSCKVAFRGYAIVNFTHCVSRAIDQALSGAASARTCYTSAATTSPPHSHDRAALQLGRSAGQRHLQPRHLEPRRGIKLHNADFELGDDAQGNIPRWQSQAGGTFALDAVTANTAYSLNVTNHGGSVSGKQLDKHCAAGDSFAVRCAVYARWERCHGFDFLLQRRRRIPRKLLTSTSASGYGSS